MRHSIDPRQEWLFDSSLHTFSKLAQRRLLEDWPGLFRTCLLALMPVAEVEPHFAETMGRPTKELYSICGLVLLMEFNDWTVEQAADSYMFDGRVQYALNLGRDSQSMSRRTLERYQRIFREEELGKDLMDRITRHLIDLLEVKVDKLRLDSTHVFSNMASFGRTRLMMTATRSFLIQLKRHDAKEYKKLPSDLRDRYAKKSWEFGKGRHACPSREQIAEDMHYLIVQFGEDERFLRRTSFQDLFRVFTEQCDVVEHKIIIREKTGGNVMQNPSDPDATFDGKKGQGYQVQTAETCSDENETQLIVGAIAQTACEHDQNAIEPVVEDLKQSNINPSEIVADAGYSGDRNYLHCDDQGIHLIAPVIQGNRKEGRIELSEFEIDSANCIQRCPAGFVPLKNWFDDKDDRGAAVFAQEQCKACALLKLCQARRNGKNYYVYYDGRALRTSLRKKEMLQPDIAALYAKRSGIEAAYSTAKNTDGMRRLRVRGRPSVFHAIYGRILGSNIRRAAKSEKIWKLVKKKLTQQLPTQRQKWHWRLLWSALTSFIIYNHKHTSVSECQSAIAWTAA